MLARLPMPLASIEKRNLPSLMLARTARSFNPETSSSRFISALAGKGEERIGTFWTNLLMGRRFRRSGP
jgi:hypothetical protein